MALIFSRMIGAVWNNPLVEIALSTILAHGSFIIAEHVLHVSGVITTVVAGLTLGLLGAGVVQIVVIDRILTARKKRLLGHAY